MKRSRLKIAAGVLSAALMFTIGGIAGTNIKGANATIGSFNQRASLPIQKLREIALNIINGRIVKQKYDFENGQRVVEFDIIDKNGVKREITLYTSNGKVHDIDYDYDNQGNRFINKNLFEVNVEFEQAQRNALARVPGTVVAHKQDAENGLFVYEFIIRSNNGLLYEVDVETKTGSVIKLEIEDDFNPGEYFVVPTAAPQIQQTVVQQPAPAPAPAPVPAPAPAPMPAPAPAPAPAPSGNKSEAQLRSIVLKHYPGSVLYVKRDYDDGMIEFEYKIRQSNGMVVEVQINQLGWITDVDYDDDYYDWD